MSLSKIAIGAVISRARINSTPIFHILPRLSYISHPFTRKQMSFSLLSPPPWYNYARFGVLRVQAYHDGRPRGPLWRGKKMIGKEALYVIMGLKRFKDDEEKLQKFIKTHVFRLLKLDMIAVLNELERQQEVSLAVKVKLSILYFSLIP